MPINKFSLFVYETQSIYLEQFAKFYFGFTTNEETLPSYPKGFLIRKIVILLFIVNLYVCYLNGGSLFISYMFFIGGIPRFVYKYCLVLYCYT